MLGRVAPRVIECLDTLALERHLAALLVDFFAFWVNFDLSRVACVRLGRSVPTADSAVAHASQARVASADGRTRLLTGSAALLLEDPIECDENVARTLADTHEWRAELARAHDLIGRGEPWCALCVAPRRHKPELRPYLLAGLPDDLRGQVEAFVAGGGPARLALPPMDGGQRLAMHQLASGLNLTSKSAGAGAARHVMWYRIAERGITEAAGSGWAGVLDGASPETEDAGHDEREEVHQEEVSDDGDGEHGAATSNPFALLSTLWQ